MTTSGRDTPQRPANSAPLPAPPSAELERIFRDHRRRVFVAAFRVTGSEQDAEDVLQTVFLRLLARGGGNHLSDRPGAYLRRAAVNGALDLLRARGRSRAVPLDEEEAMAVSPVPDPEAQEAGRELRRALRKAVSSLGRRSAEVFALRFFEGLRNKEIAQLLGVPQTTVGVLVHRARKAVRNEMAGLLGDRHDG